MSEARSKAEAESQAGQEVVVNTDAIADLVDAARAGGQQVVAVVGLGFVGTAVVANLSRTEADGRSLFFIIGLDRDDEAGRAKVTRLNRGDAPVYAGDKSLAGVIAAGVEARRNITATVDVQALAYVDVVVCCIDLDVNRAAGQVDELAVPTGEYTKALRTIGRSMRPGTLVCIESTLPVGMSDQVLYPALCDGQLEQGVDVRAQPPLYAYCYERVMPGPEYLDSVNRFWRSYAGIDEASADAAEAFLTRYVDTEHFPLWRHKTIRAAELAKLMENAYRATNIAFVDEWAEFAEGAGVDLFDVISSIRVRQGTHDNMMRPGLGVGGYCLTKDALLALYGGRELLGLDASLPFSERAILTNEAMPLRAVQWIRAHLGGSLSGRKAALIGVTYRPGVVDSRSSAAEIVARALLADGATVVAHDPLIEVWEELPEVPVVADPREALLGADAVVICLPDAAYRDWLPGALLALPESALVVDPWNMVGDDLAAALRERGVATRVYGRGDLSGAR